MAGITYLVGPQVGYLWVWVRVLIWLPTRNPYPWVPMTHVYWVGFLNLEMAGGHTTHSTNAWCHHELYSSIPATIYVYLHTKKTPHPFCDSCIHPIAMPRDEVDPSTITNEPQKRTLSSYVCNQDNISGDRDIYVKRIKQTVNPGMFPNSSYSLTLILFNKNISKRIRLCKPS